MKEANVYYFSGAKVFPFLVLVLPSQSEPILITTSLEAGQARKESWIKDVRGFQCTETSLEAMVKQALADCNVERGSVVGVEIDYISSRSQTKLKSVIPHVRFGDGSSIPVDLRKRKSEKEISLIKKAAEIADKGMMAALEAIEPGKSELEIAAVRNFR